METQTFLLLCCALNLLSLIHFLFKRGYKLKLKQQLFTYLLFLIPIAGFLIYLVWYVWSPPEPSPKHLRQERHNHYGASNFDQQAIVDDKKFKGNLEVSPKDDSNKYLEDSFLPLTRVFAFLFGLLILLYGLISIRDGDLTYKNYWGLTVFGPYSVITGLIIIFIVIFKWKKTK